MLRPNKNPRKSHMTYIVIMRVETITFGRCFEKINMACEFA